jgi:signal transduction histidine kinase
MRLSLARRVFLLVLAANVAVFALGGAVLFGKLRGESGRVQRQLADNLSYTLAGTIRTGGEPNVARILAWPGWAAVEDAILIDAHWVELPGGLIRPVGVHLNPKGRAERAARFDEQEVLRALVHAMRAGTPIDVAGGRAAPILVHSRDLLRGGLEAWGGCWYRVAPGWSNLEVVRELLPWFLASTLVLTLVLFTALRVLVLEPVQQLAGAARRVEAGDLAARARATGRQDELAELVHGFNAMAATVEGARERLEAEAASARAEARAAEESALAARMLASTGQLAAGIAHEINNPLGGLINAVEVLGRPDLSPAKRVQYLGLLSGGLERIRATVGQLLRLTPRTAEARAPVRVNLGEVVLDALSLVEHRAARAGVAVEIALAGGERPARKFVYPDVARADFAGLPAILGAPHELGQALLNLLINALDALEDPTWRARPGAPPPRLALELAASSGELALTVRDNGPGVEAALLPRLAELFFTTKDPGRGTGLGLPLVYKLVAAAGGRVELASAPGRGLAATLTFPRLGAESGRADAARGGEKPAGPAELGRSGGLGA